MDQFKRKSKDAEKSDTRKDRHTISVMERGAVANMMKSGKAANNNGNSPLRTGLPSLPSAVRRDGGNSSVVPATSVLQTTLQTAIPPPHEWTVKKPTKPGSFLRVLWKNDPATRLNFAWWDSEDGLQGGKMLRCSVMESDRRAIKEFDLFPSSDGGEQIISIVTSGEQTVEVPYVTFSFLSADEVGPPGMLFIAPPGVQFPIDALWIKPSLEKQLERKQVEQQRVNDEIEMQRTEASINEIKVSVERREAMERKSRQEIKLKKLLNCARMQQAPGNGSSRPASGLQEEFAVWKQLSPSGLPPPPQKHAIALLYEFEVQKDVSIKPSGDADAGDKEQAEAEKEDTALVGFLLTLEVWSHNFTERYNIFLSARNAINGAGMKLETLGYTGLKWFRTYIFDAQTAPSTRDSPGLCYDGKDGLLLFGGKTKGGDYKTFFNDLWRFDYKKNRWHMYEESVRVYDRGWKETVGLKGKMPTSRSSATMTYRREGERGNEEDVLYIAGGADRQGKSMDVRKLCLESTSPHYLRWNELIPSNRRVIVDSDMAIGGDAPKRGFCCKGLCTQDAIYAPQLGDGEILQLDLRTKQWRSLKFDKFLAWKTSKILCIDFEVMTRFVSVDFQGNSETGYPGVETGEAWNIYTAADENDNRETATSQQWLLCPGQVMNFQTLSSFGDKPGTWSAHTLSKGFIHRKGQLLTRFYCFGGSRKGGESCLPPLPDEYRTPQVVGRDQLPRIGMRVRASRAFWERYSAERRFNVGDSFRSTASARSLGSHRSPEFPGEEDATIDEAATESTEFDPDVLGVITTVHDVQQHIDDLGKVTYSKIHDVIADVRFDGHSVDVACKCGEKGVFDLIEHVDMNLYKPSGGMLINELWTLDIKESMQLPTLIQRFEDLKRIRGHTDEFSLTQVLGKRIRIEDRKKARAAAAARK